MITVVLEKEKSKLGHKGPNTEHFHLPRYSHRSGLNFYNLVDNLGGTKEGRGGTEGERKEQREEERKNGMKSSRFW